MDTQAEFFEREIDRTPYTAFGWLAGIVIVIVVLGSYVLWHAASYVKARHWLESSNVSGATDNLLNNAGDSAAAALDTAQAAAAQAAQTQADNAAAAATQALLNQADATIQSAADAAKQSATQAITSPSPSVGGVDALQQYLNQ